MDRYVVRTTKRQKLDTDGTTAEAVVPSLYTDFWRLVVSHLEWPELFACTKVSRVLRKVAFPLLKQKTDAIRQHIAWDTVEYKWRESRSRRGKKATYHVWTLKGFHGHYSTLEHPRLVNSSTIFGLLQTIFRELDWRLIWRYFGVNYIRFCRIVGIYTGHRYVCWSQNE
jgi:hypothetical protein